MTTYTKPAVRNAWGQTASASDLQDPGNTYASAGWQIGVKPPRQYFNWVLNYVFAGIRYYCQSGIPAWDAAETYSSGAYVLSPNGYLCRAPIGSTNQNPDAVFGPGQSWDSPAVRTPPYPDNSGRVPNTSWVYTNFIAVGASFASITGQISSAQVPVGAVTQWQGSLSIGGSQITSAVARANTVFNTSGQYATFNWSGQSGQPSWLWGSNDGLNFYVWNPSNFSVSNSQALQGLTPTSAAAGNTVMLRDANGYAYAIYLNQASPNNENPSISQFMVTNGADNFLRKASVATAKAALGALATSDFPALLSVNGYQKLPSGVILQWGEATISGTTTVTFPIAFPNNAASVVFTIISSTNQIFLNGAPLGRTSFSATNGNAVISWFAVGY